MTRVHYCPDCECHWSSVNRECGRYLDYLCLECLEAWLCRKCYEALTGDEGSTRGEGNNNRSGRALHCRS
jgi:hypothetical protein